MRMMLSSLLAACFAGALPAWTPQAQPPADPVRATIDKAIAWIARQAVPVPDHAGAVLFPETAGRRRPLQPQIYGGAAGVLIFLENAAKVLGDAKASELADATAKGLLAVQRQTDAGQVTWVDPGAEGAASLYTGDAGVGAAFLVRARLRGDKEALAVAVAAADSILARGRREGDQLSWDRQVEVIFGAAGTALFLLDLGAETKEPRFTEAALAAGRWLIGQAKIDAPQENADARSLSWRWALAGNSAYVNFSHGTAGVAYALARVGAATKDAACAQAAVDGASWLDHQAKREGDHIVWPVLAGSKTTMGGWCHGPPGTARLYLYLHQVTGEQRYLDTALASARWVMAQAPADDRDAAFPPSLCCGVAGVLDFFCDLYRATRKNEFKAFAQRAGHYLMQSALTDGDGVKWPKGATHSGRNAQVGVDLMLGTPGNALALLRLLTLEQANDPVCHLPDRAVR